MSKQSDNEFFTEEHVNVTERIKNGRTKFVKTRTEAEFETRKVGYFYTVCDVNGSYVGFGIPK